MPSSRNASKILPVNDEIYILMQSSVSSKPGFPWHSRLVRMGPSSLWQLEGRVSCDYRLRKGLEPIPNLGSHLKDGPDTCLSYRGQKKYVQVTRSPWARKRWDNKVGRGLLFSCVWFGCWFFFSGSSLDLGSPTLIRAMFMGVLRALLHMPLCYLYDLQKQLSGMLIQSLISFFVSNTASWALSMWHMCYGFMMWYC